MILFTLLIAAALTPQDFEKVRDRQDRPALERFANDAAGAARARPTDAVAQYRAAVAASYLAEVALELRDKNVAERAAQGGIGFAERAIAIEPRNAEYHRILGTLCGQVVPANILGGLRYGKRAQEEIGRALELDPKSARAYLSRGVGNYYLPAPFGPGNGAAIQDFRKAIELDKSNADAWLWLGLALRKEKQNAEARQAFTKAVALAPNRVWAKQQLEKTPER